MKYALIFILSLVTSFAHAGVINAFEGQYDLNLWTHEDNGGQIILTDAPNSLTQVSSDSGSGVEEFTDSTIEAQDNGLVSFDWVYSSNDLTPAFDQFGWLLNGDFFKLTIDNAGTDQSGSASFLVNIGDIFGFRTLSTDSGFDSATTLISNFTIDITEVPAPSTLILLALAIIAVRYNRKS